jgi:hypothetical protein
LKRIARGSFSGSLLNSICIPETVDFIDGAAFADCRLQTVVVDSASPRFLVDRDFLIDQGESRLVR